MRMISLDPAPPTVLKPYPRWQPLLERGAIHQVRRTGVRYWQHQYQPPYSFQVATLTNLSQVPSFKIQLHHVLTIPGISLDPAPSPNWQDRALQAEKKLAHLKGLLTDLGGYGRGLGTTVNNLITE